MLLPELGGRIQRAFDKTNQYDFVYYNHVIKPALVGLCGPWISGGIEFNWPQHHRPTTYVPVDYKLKRNADGSASLLVSDVDRMYGTKGYGGIYALSGQSLYRDPRAALQWHGVAADFSVVGQSGCTGERLHSVDISAGCAQRVRSWQACGVHTSR